MALVDGPVEESDNLICVAYRHQFDVVNESTGEAFRLHHVEASRVSSSGTVPVQCSVCFTLNPVKSPLVPSK